jgi:lipid II:glycine glycyltransferase (peptidoglycan interpeptide bridge formation enzyme)
MLKFLKAEARKRGVFMLKVEPSATDESANWLQALRRHGFQMTPHMVSPRSEWVLDLQPEEKDILAGMKEKWRYNIRLAGRKGVTVRRGKDQADLDTFYAIYETTSQRDAFFIHNKSFYEEIVRLYEQDDRCALFIAEYEGVAISAIIVLHYGRWSWYMYGASSNEQRNLMPNHLLQWNGMQWAKAHGCWYYNFRGIPDVLEEGQELWGVYLFKRGFGGYAIRALETHDLVYQPLVYQVYRRLLEIKRWRDEKRHTRPVSQNGTNESQQQAVEIRVGAPSKNTDGKV